MQSFRKQQRQKPSKNSNKTEYKVRKRRTKRTLKTFLFSVEQKELGFVELSIGKARRSLTKQMLKILPCFIKLSLLLLALFSKIPQFMLVERSHCSRAVNF